MNKKEYWVFLAAFPAFKIKKYLIQAEQTKQTPSRWLVCSGKRNPQNSIIVRWAQKVMYFFATLILRTSRRLTTNPKKLFFPNFLP
ncbi:MAG TPA: hypothetical protein VF411_04020 [Bacteroidia bacterium]